MERTERKKLVKELTRYRKLSSRSIILFFVLIVSMIVLSVSNITPKIDLESQTATYVTIYLACLLICILAPLFTSLWFMMLSQSRGFRYTRECMRVIENRQKVRVVLFWDLIKKHKYIEAKELYNYDNYITDKSLRVLCNGVLIGTMQLYGNYDGWGSTADDRMGEYLKLD